MRIRHCVFAAALAAASAAVGADVRADDTPQDAASGIDRDTLAGPIPTPAQEDLSARGVPKALREPAMRVLERAFDNLYGADMRDDLDIEAHADGKVVRRHQLRVLRKHVDGRPMTLVRFVTDNDYWDMRVLKIGNPDRSDDHFIWVPALNRVRRFTSVQKADPFIGTDLTLEDLEVHIASRYEVLGRAFSILRGEPVQVLTIAPLYDLGYTRAVLFVALSDYAVLEAHYYRGEHGRRPYKVSRAPRDQMVQMEGHVLPQLWIFTDYERGTETWARYTKRVVADDLDDKFFSERTLQTNHPTRIFGN